MDWSSAIETMGPWGCTLAAVVWAFLQKRNDPEKDEKRKSNDPERDEIFVRLRGVEERLARVEECTSWIRSAIEKLEGAK